ncbi:MAG TPA: tripartite tricarboxylate transporter TctB family protein [Burkholderiales bacterium]
MHNRASLILSSAVALFAAWGLVSAMSWPLKAKLFPLVVGIPLLCLAIAEIIYSLRDKSTEPPRDIPADVERHRSLVAAGWILAFFAAIVLLGFDIAVAVFVFLYLVIQGKERWIFSAIFAAATWALFYGLFDRLLHLPFPAGWLLELLGFG